MDDASAPDRWFYKAAGKKHGPLSAADLRQLITSQAIPGDTPVWHHGMESWAPAAEVAELGAIAIAPVATPLRHAKANRRKTVGMSLVAIVVAGMLASQLPLKPKPRPPEPTSLSERLIAIGRAGDLTAMPTVITAITAADGDVANTAVAVAEGLLGMRYSDADRSSPQTLALKVQDDWKATQRQLQRRKAGKEMLLP
jgi:hypothetical protein